MINRQLIAVWVLVCGCYVLGMLLLVKCSGTSAEIGETVRERYVRALVGGGDAAELVDSACSVSTFTEFLEGWQLE